MGLVPAASRLAMRPYPGIAEAPSAGGPGSAATTGEGRPNTPCAYLAGARWRDAMVGLLIAAVVLTEGVD